jgi:hypothetical protein
VPLSPIKRCAYTFENRKDSLFLESLSHDISWSKPQLEAMIQSRTTSITNKSTVFKQI